MGKKLGLKIKQLRSDYSFITGEKITQKDLADRLGISRSYLGDIESGRTPASDEIIHKLSVIFNVDYNNLLTLKYDDQENVVDDSQLKMETTSNDDNDLIIIERARKKMNDKDKEKMMNMLRVAFDEYFND